MNNDSPRPTSTPIAFFIFNRPHFTQRVFESIAAVKPPKLLVIADGPRPEKTGEVGQCLAAREVIEKVDWPCEVLTEYSSDNLGCKRRLATGLDWVFSQVQEAIVLEDDTLPHPSFFPFCEKLLARFRTDERVHMIRGSNFLFDARPVPWSFYFSRFYNIWGWATWARAWEHYDVEMRVWTRLRETDWLERYLPRTEMAELVRYFFDETHAGRIDTWDYQWMLAGWLNDALAIAPATNLVRNIGFGAEATHTFEGAHRLDLMTIGPMRFPLRAPPSVQAHDRADLLEWNHTYPQAARRGLRGRLGRRLRSLLP